MTSEVELKLELACADAEAFACWNRLPETADVANLKAIYFDTPDRALSRRGISLRIRQSGRKRVQTVKAEGGGGAGLYSRAEWEMPVRGDVPVLDARTPVVALLGEAAQTIEPVFHVDVERRTWMLSEGGASIELVLNRGEVSAGERQSPVCEIEMELKRGDPAALFALARLADAEVPVRLGVLTKAERGYRLCDAMTGAVKAEPVALDPKAKAEEAFGCIAHACLRHYRLNEALLLDHYDVKPLHQARVAIRRLRSAFTLFKPMLAKADVTRFQDELRWLAGMLGEARNLDVLAERIEGMDPHRLEAVRSKIHGGVEQWLRSARVRALMIDLTEWLTLGAGQVDGAQQDLRDGSAADFAAGRLRRLRKRIASHGAELEKLSDEARHEVRKNAKKLRYASEFFADLFARKRQRRRRVKFIAKLEEVQTDLGTLNDLISAPALLAHYRLSRSDAAPLGQKKKRKLLSAAARAQEDFVEAKRFWT